MEDLEVRWEQALNKLSENKRVIIKDYRERLHETLLDHIPPPDVIFPEYDGGPREGADICILYWDWEKWHLRVDIFFDTDNAEWFLKHIVSGKFWGEDDLNADDFVFPELKKRLIAEGAVSFGSPVGPVPKAP